MKFGIGILLIALVSFSSTGFADDPFLGTWRLRADASDFSVAMLSSNLDLAAVDLAKPLSGEASFRTKDKHEIFGVGKQKPEAMTIVMEPAEDGSDRIFYKSETVYPNPQDPTRKLISTSEYTNGYNGVPVVVFTDGRTNAPVALERTAPNEVDAVYFRGEKKIAISHRTVSADGRSMTIETTSFDENGDKVVSQLIFDKVD